MGFVVGMAIGLAFGIGLIMGFAYYQNVRARRRSELVSIVLFLLPNYDMFYFQKLSLVDFISCFCLEFFG